jgi:hypothetical protein
VDNYYRDVTPERNQLNYNYDKNKYVRYFNPRRTSRLSQATNISEIKDGNL